MNITPKISYVSSDHSAITTSDPNIFISKMGCGALVSHLWNNSPYNTNNLKYFARTLTGPTLICYGTNYTFESNLSGSFTWDKSSNLSLTGSGTSVTVTPAYFNSNGAGWVSVKNSSGAEITRVNVWVGVPTVSMISGPRDIYRIRSDWAMYCPLQDEPFANITMYQWEVKPRESVIYGISDQRSFGVHFKEEGDVMVEFSAYNACGIYFEQIWVCIYEDYFYSAYPNPTSSTLNIDINQTAGTQAKVFEQTTTDAKQLKQDKTFDIRLYDNQGTLLRHKKTKGGKVEFNLANLPNGIYYLHIYDGINEKPEMRQIMVEH